MIDADEINTLKRWNIDLILDVGANTGQTGLALRKAGFQGRIFSFEPLPECFEKLSGHAADDPLWEARNLALSNRGGTAEIGVSQNLVSSSLLQATDELIQTHEPVRYTHNETVKLARLDKIWPDIVPDGSNVHLKLDVQGSEAAVMQGARGVLLQISTVRMEVAVLEVYEGETILPDMIRKMTVLGFDVIGGWPAWRHPETNEVLHFDMLFRRQGLTQNSP